MEDAGEMRKTFTVPEIKPLNQYDFNRAKVCASVRWLLAKSYGSAGKMGFIYHGRLGDVSPVIDAVGRCPWAITGKLTGHRGLGFSQGVYWTEPRICTVNNNGIIIFHSKKVYVVKVTMCLIIDYSYM